MTRPVKVAYILSVGHSGSSLLDVLLGGSEGAISIGEMKLNQRGILTNAKCTCGKGIRECGFWKQVEQKLDEHNQSMFHTRFADDLTTREQQNIIRFYQAVQSASGAKLIVDSSKSISRLRSLGGTDEDIDLRIVFLERSPWGVVASNVRRGRNWIKHTFVYLINNTSRRHFASLHSNLHIRYEDIVNNPEEITAEIYDYLEFEPEAVKANGVDLSPEKHMLGGNPMLYRPITEITQDNRWKTELSWLQQKFIGVICHPVLEQLVFTTIRVVRAFNRKPSS